jgi:hypothetical protein
VPPDYPVHQRSNGYFAQRLLAKAEFQMNSARQSRAAVRGAPDSEQYMSGAAPDYPVPLEDKGSNGRLRPNPNGWVTWLAHRTVRCVHRQQPLPNGCLVVEGYKYPSTTPLQPSKHSRHCIQYKSNRLHSKTQIKAIDPLKAPNSTLAH